MKLYWTNAPWRVVTPKRATVIFVIEEIAPPDFQGISTHLCRGLFNDKSSYFSVYSCDIEPIEFLTEEHKQQIPKIFSPLEIIQIKKTYNY